MRVDKFLKNSRIIKRRPVAKEACDGGRVSLNGKRAKAGDEVAVGDILEVSFGENLFRCEILEVSDNVAKKDAGSLYKVLS